MATTEQQALAATTNTERTELFIGGKWVPSTGSNTIEVINPATEEVMGHVPEGTKEDVDAAVAAAQEAFVSWSQTSPDERAALLMAVAQLLQQRSEEIAALISREMGMPMTLSVMIQAGLPAMDVGSIPGLMEEIRWEEEIGNSLVV